ncbi:MAG: hypothetical protein RL490_2058 [Pseudomonadota bacterium]|jgi:hypothetical protein
MTPNMAITPRHALPLLAAGQAQKEVTHNEALLALDRLVQLCVLSRSVTAPPPAPAAGDCYIVPAAATGVWAGQGDRLASHDGFGWVFDTPPRGCLAWLWDEGVFAVYSDGWTAAAWPVRALAIGGRIVLGAVPAILDAPSGGATIDAEARVAIAALQAALRAQGIAA